MRNELDLVYYTVRAAWPHLKAYGGGSIINVGSIAALRGVEFMPQNAHSTAKGGVIALTLQLVVEGGPHGIRANVISPGMTETPNTAPLLADPPERMQQRRPRPDPARPARPARGRRQRGGLPGLRRVVVDQRHQHRHRRRRVRPRLTSTTISVQDGPVLGLEMVVLLGVALVMCGALARRYPIAPAILLVLVGVLVGFVPHLRHAQLPPGGRAPALPAGAALLGEPDHLAARDPQQPAGRRPHQHRPGRRHRGRGRGGGARARPGVGAGLGARRRARPDRRDRGRRPGPRPAAAHGDRAARREPGQRRHRAGALRAGRRRHRRRAAPDRLARHLAAGPRVRRRRAGRRAGRPGQLAGAPPHGRPDARGASRCS